MTPSDLRNTHTTGNSCRDTLRCTNMPLKLPQYFYLLMEKSLDNYFQVWSPYSQTTKCNQKIPIPKFIISADDIGAQIWFYIQDFQGSKLVNSCLVLVVRPNVFHWISNLCHWYTVYHLSKIKAVFRNFVEFYWINRKQLNIPQIYLEYREFYIVAQQILSRVIVAN